VTRHGRGAARVVHRCLPLLVLPLLLVGCDRARAGDVRAGDVRAGDGHTGEVQAIRDLSREFDRRLVAGDVEWLTALYTDDATIFETGLAPIRGPEAIRRHFEELAAIDFHVLATEPRRVEVAASGDLAYEVGDSWAEWEGPSGPVRDESSYVLVWRRTGETWRIEQEMFNSRLPGREP
jgi:ketosteroid isomerase-like protein